MADQLDARPPAGSGGGPGGSPTINWVTVSWVATASSNTVESNARRVLPVSTPVSAITVADGVEDPLRPVAGPQLVAPQRQHRRMEPLVVSASPAATFQRRSVRNACTASRSDRPSSDCSTITVAITSAGTDGRPRPDAEQIGEQLVREQPLAVLGQERVHRPGRHQMPDQRRRVQQLPVRIRRALHTTILFHPRPKTRAPNRIAQQSPSGETPTTRHGDDASVSPISAVDGDVRGHRPASVRRLRRGQTKRAAMGSPSQAEPVGVLSGACATIERFRPRQQMD